MFLFFSCLVHTACHFQNVHATGSINYRALQKLAMSIAFKHPHATRRATQTTQRLIPVQTIEQMRPTTTPAYRVGRRACLAIHEGEPGVFGTSWYLPPFYLSQHPNRICFGCGWHGSHSAWRGVGRMCGPIEWVNSDSISNNFKLIVKLQILKVVMKDLLNLKICWILKLKLKICLYLHVDTGHFK